MYENIKLDRIPVLALRGLVVYPKQTVHFDVAREKSVKALEKAMETDHFIFLVPQRDIAVDDPDFSDLHHIGTVVRIKQMLKSTGDTIRVLVSGICRAEFVSLSKTEPYMLGAVTPMEEQHVSLTSKVRALIRDANANFGTFLEMTQQSAQPLQLRLLTETDPGFVADCLAQHTTFDYADKIRLLTITNPAVRLERAVHLLAQELDMLRIEFEIQAKARESMDKNHRDYYLREQMRAIRTELGEGDEDNDIEIYRDRIQKLQLKEDVQKKLLKDVDRLAKQPFGSSEGAVLRNYLDTVLDLPWNRRTEERIDLTAAAKILDKDHFGMEKVKERILEALAVRQLTPKMPPQVLCLVGPPGVGKTSVAYSIARCLNRKMARLSLGGVRDEADIRGHRKTYVGAMPGRIMSALIQAGSSNALLLLDEVDKLGSDHRGDPSAALLEVLDAEQNHTYRDHYLEIPFDLSDVMFITTANTLDTIPRPLLDRMEIIELGSYTDEEKLMIAKRHLYPKQLAKHGLKRGQLRLSDDAIRMMIRGYTRESGVRNLERVIGKLCRKAAVLLVEDRDVKRISVTPKNLETFLGVRRYAPEHAPVNDEVGLVTGLAWTSVGGEVLEVEVNVMDGTGKLELTGNLGDVMKESARAAISYIRSHAAQLGVQADFYKAKDIHVHFPEGAVPKDGPSAGITVCTAIVSALTGRPVRRDIAMTGEISIRGRVMAIGGLREKTMAALRHGVATVIIPKDNERDLQQIDPAVREKLEFIAAEHIETVLTAALRELPEQMVTQLPTVAVKVAGDSRLSQ